MKLPFVQDLPNDIDGSELSHEICSRPVFRVFSPYFVGSQDWTRNEVETHERHRSIEPRHAWRCSNVSSVASAVFHPAIFYPFFRLLPSAMIGLAKSMETTSNAGNHMICREESADRTTLRGAELEISFLHVGDAWQQYRFVRRRRVSAFSFPKMVADDCPPQPSPAGFAV